MLKQVIVQGQTLGSEEKEGGGMGLNDLVEKQGFLALSIQIYIDSKLLMMLNLHLPVLLHTIRSGGLY